MMPDPTDTAQTEPTAAPIAPETRAPTILPEPSTAPAAEIAALPTYGVGDEIEGLGVVAGVRIVRGEGEYVKIGSPDADWVRL
jgi:hypothetical protein